MDTEAARQFLLGLGCDPDKTKPDLAGQWYRAPCPLSWRHSGGRDNSPSFGVKIIPNGQSICNCLACHYSDSPLNLLWKLRAATGRDYSELANKLVIPRDQLGSDDFAIRTGGGDDNPLTTMRQRLARANYSYSTPPPDIFYTPGGNPLSGIEAPALNEADLAPFKVLTKEALAYFHNRGLSDKSISKWELGWHDSARRLVFPIRDSKSRLVGISGRVIDPDRKPKYLHSQGFRKALHLYGENDVTPGKPCIITEGFTDVIMLRQLGFPNTLAYLGTSIQRMQVEKILDLFTYVVIMGDGDGPGRESLTALEAAFAGRIPVEIINLPEGSDPADLALQDPDFFFEMPTMKRYLTRFEAVVV